MHPRGDGVAAEQVTVVVSVVPGELEPVDTQGFALTEEQNHSIFASRVGREARVKVGAEYELYGLAHGAWTLKGRSPGLLDYRNTILITDAEPSVRVDMEMGRRNVVRVALRDPDGSPFVKAIQKLNPDLYQRLSPFVCTEDPSPAAIAARRGSLETLASSSHYLLNPESDAWCDVEADLRTRTWIGVSLGDVRLAWTPLDPYQESVALTLAVDELKALLGALTVTVTDKASGSPLKGAVVNIEPNQGVARHVRTDERGTCEWKNQVAAPVRVWVGCEGYCREEQSLILRGGQRAEVSVELVQPVSLSGRLVDEQGRGIPGALRASWKDRDPDTGDATRTTVAKADGVFEFTLVHPGEYFIEADAIRLDDEQQEADETQPDAALRAYVDARFASAYGIVVKRAVQRKEKPH